MRSCPLQERPPCPPLRAQDAYRDGTTHIVLEPLDLMARLAALVPTPRLKRVFGVEIEGCARCGGKLKIIASIEEPQVIAKILSHLERAAEEQYCVFHPK